MLLVLDWASVVGDTIIDQKTHLEYLVCTMPNKWGVLAFLLSYRLWVKALWVKSVKYDVYIYTLMWYWQYLLSVIYITTCTGFVLGWRLSTERVVAQPLHYIFCPPSIKVLESIKFIATLCSSMWSCEVSLYAHVHVSSRYVIHI